MDEILKSLATLVVNALPTLILVLLLHFYLKATFFKPLEAVMKQRHEATAGARKLADQAFARANEKMAQYEEAIRNARTEVYKEQETIRQQFRAEQATAVAEAKAKAGALVAAARAQISSDTAEAKAALAGESERIADQIADSLLARRAA